MEFLKAYLLTLTVFIFISSAVMGFLTEGPLKKTVRLVMGAILALIIIVPVSGIKIENLDIFSEGDEYILYSEKNIDIQRRQLEDILSQRLGEYLNKRVKVVIADDKIHIDAVGCDKAEIAEFLGVPEDNLNITE